MVRFSALVLLLASLLTLAACGGNTSRDASAADPDAGPSDATTVVDATSPPDASTGALCEGSSKAEHSGALASPVAVTSALVIMDCCDGFTLRFHSQAQLGFDVAVMVRHFAGPLLSGKFELPSDAGGLEVAAYDPSGPPGLDATVSGSLSIEAPSSYEELSYVSACLSVSAPGQAIDGTRLYASHVPIAPYAWSNRLEVRLLDDPAITADDAAKLPLDALKLAGPALFDLMAIEWYDGKDHTVTWDGWHSSKYIVGQLPPVGVHGLPFVVMANGQRAYLGAFVSALSSVALSMPVIVIENMKEDSFQIDSAYPTGAQPGNDARNHPAVLAVLESAGKLVK